MPQRFDLIVFDWDGTLLDSTVGIARSIQDAAREVGLKIPTDEQASHVIGLGLRDALEHAVPDLQDAEYAAFIAAYQRHFRIHDAETELFDGAREMLKTLEAAGHRLAIATGKSRAGLARALTAVALTKRFIATRCADQTAPKPNPHMLLELMEELDTRPERVVMIGDTTHDLQMAASAGVAALGVSYGAHPREKLVALPTLAIFDSTRELARWLTANG